MAKIRAPDGAMDPVADDRRAWIKEHPLPVSSVAGEAQRVQRGKFFGCDDRIRLRRKERLPGLWTSLGEGDNGPGSCAPPGLDCFSGSPENPEEIDVGDSCRPHRREQPPGLADAADYRGVGQCSLVG
jgi:hypothetical protein